MHSRSIEKIILEKINPYNEIVFMGAGEYWEAQYKVSYVEYFIKDEEGKLYYDSFHYESGEVTYKGNKQEVNEFSYKYETAGSEGFGKRSLNKNGKSSLGHGGGNGMFPRKDAIIKFEIKWDGKTEEFDLKAIK